MRILSVNCWTVEPSNFHHCIAGNGNPDALQTRVAERVNSTMTSIGPLNITGGTEAMGRENNDTDKETLINVTTTIVIHV